MSKISYKIQDQWVAEQSPAIIELEYNGTKIEINPALSLEQRRDYCEIVWGIFHNEIDGSFHPEFLEFGQRVALLYTYTNLKIDLGDIRRSYNLVMHTGLYDVIESELAKRHHELDVYNLRGDAERYVELKTQDMQAINSAIYANLNRSKLDELLESVLSGLDGMLTKFSADNADVSAQSVIDAIATMGKLNDEDKLVENVLQFHAEDEQ